MWCKGFVITLDGGVVAIEYFEDEPRTPRDQQDSLVAQNEVFNVNKR